jgi:hypothetical protein
LEKVKTSFSPADSSEEILNAIEKWSFGGRRMGAQYGVSLFKVHCTHVWSSQMKPPHINAEQIKNKNK